MPSLANLDPATPTDEILQAIEADGAVVVTGVLASDQLRRIHDETAPWVQQSPSGRDDFTGRNTSRTGALVARSPASREAVTNEMVLAVANGFLSPFTNRIQLHLTQIIRIGAEQGAQALHRDRLACD